MKGNIRYLLFPDSIKIAFSKRFFFNAFSASKELTLRFYDRGNRKFFFLPRRLPDGIYSLQNGRLRWK
jgi:hypothetical protein